MPPIMDLPKIKKTIRIFAVAQGALIALLVFMAVLFQQRLQLLGKGEQFMNGVVAAFVIQLLLFYPVFRFANKEAERDFSLIGKTLNQEELKSFTKQKRWADVVKMAVFGFFFIFILALKPTTPTLVLSVVYYSFVLTVITYLQCYNFAARKRSKTLGTP